MSVVRQLVGFGLRQALGESAENLTGLVEQYVRDHGQTLPRALDRAHDRAWQALGIALAGDGLLDRVRVFFASGDDKGVREQIRVFLESQTPSFAGTPDEFRRDCLEELKRLRKSGLLSMQGMPAAEIARLAAACPRFTETNGLVEGARLAVAKVSTGLQPDYPQLARLLALPTPSGPPLLAGAFAYFFRREVETDEELAHGLFFDSLRQLSASQGKAFVEVVGQLVEGTLFSQVYANCSGVITRILVENGTRVAPGMPLFEALAVAE